MDDAQVVAIIAAIYQHAAVISGRSEVPDDHAATWANDLLVQAKVVTPKSDKVSK